MIRVNLLPVIEAVERTPPQLYAVLALVLGLGGLGFWYWSLTGESSKLEEQVGLLQTESQRLQQITLQVEEFEQRKQALEARIGVIDQLEANQKGPVQLMNDVIAGIPENPQGLWLTNLVQRESSVTIEGRAFDVTFIADFIAALDNSSSFRSVELQFWEQDTDNSIRFGLQCETEG